MRTNSNSRRLGLALVAMVSACAHAGMRDLAADLYWPPAPDAPRIQYLESFYGSNYFPAGFSQGLAAALVGADPSQVLYKPIAVAADGRGNVYVTDGPGHIMVLDRERLTVRRIGDKPATKLFGPGGLAFHNGRNELYACDSARGVVLVYRPETGEVLRQLATGGRQPVGVAVDEFRDRIAVSDGGDHTVRVLDAASGNVVYTIGGRGGETGQFNMPIAVAFDRQGRLFVTDMFNFRVQIFSETGVFERAFGSIGLWPGQFTRPKGIAVDSEGHAYVVDAAFGKVQIFDGDAGDILLQFGSSGDGPGQFWLPHGIYVDERDRIYVVDQLNARVSIFRYIPRAEAQKLKLRGAAAPPTDSSPSDPAPGSSPPAEAVPE